MPKWDLILSLFRNVGRVLARPPRLYPWEDDVKIITTTASAAAAKALVRIPIPWH